jgi:hypothetical protein
MFDLSRHLRSRTFWLRVVLGVFVLINCRYFARHIRSENAARRSGPDAVTAADQAFRRALPFLPERGWVGYVKTDFTKANGADMAAFFQAQYAVAPRVLVEGTTPDLVIAAARGHGELPAIPEGFVLEQTFTGRLALLRRVK